MKKYTSVIAVLVAIVLVCSLIACTQKPKTESVTQAVTNENGEVVTGENGEIVTEEIEAQVVTDENGAPVTEVVTDGEGKPVTTVKDGKYENVTQVVVNAGGSARTNAPAKNNAKKNTTAAGKKSKTTTTKKSAVKKPTAPSAPSNLKGTATDSSVTLSWKAVKCTGYEIKCTDEYGAPITSFKSKTNGATVKGLEAYTKYNFSVRAYSSNSAGTSVSKWVSKSVTTKENTSARNITLSIKLPMDANKEDTLTIKVNDDSYTKKVNLDGSVYTFKTPNKYKGEVKVDVSLKEAGASFNGKTKKDTYSIDISGLGIEIIDGEDD